MEKKKKKKKSFSFLRILAKILLGLILLLFLLVLFLRSQWGQDVLKDQLISSLSEKTGTTIEVDRLYLTFTGKVIMEDLYLEDRTGDTLVFSEMLEADVPLWPIIRGKDIRVNSLVSSGFKANIIRKDSISGFNYEFLLEALAPADTTKVTTADTTVAKRNFIIEDIKVNSFDLDFIDQVAGMETSVKVGTLGLQMEVFDLANLSFHASKAVLSDSEISYIRTKPFPDNVDEEEVPLPYIIADQLFMENVVAHYESVPDGLVADLDIGDLSLRLPEADLSGNIINIDYFHLRDSKVAIVTSPGTTPVEEVSLVETEAPGQFQWPPWDITVNEFVLDNDDIAYRVKGVPYKKGEFNPKAMDLRNLQLVGMDIFLHESSAGGRLRKMGFHETTGIRLRDSGLDFSVDEKTLNLERLVVDLNNNRLKGQLRLNYTSLQDFIDTPDASEIKADLSQVYLEPEDLFLFQPALKSNQYIRTLAKNDLSGQLRAEGTLASMQIFNADFSWGNTSLNARGHLKNALQPEALAFNFPSVFLNSTGGDIGQFIEQDSLGVKIPDDLNLRGSFKGNLENITADLELKTSEGDITAEGFFNSQGQLTFDARVQVLDLDLGILLQNKKLGELNLRIIAEGQGANINSLNAALETTVESFSYNGYPINGLEIIGKVEDGKGPVYTQYQDDNLNMTMENFLILDSVATQVNTNLDVIGANLQALGMSRRLIKVGFEVDASFRGNAEAYDVNAEIVDGVTVYGNKSYLLGDFLLSARVRPDSTALDIRNQLLNVNLRSNADPGSFANALQRHYRSYLSATVETDTVENPVNLQFHAEIRENPILNEVFFSQLDELDTVDISVDFRERDREMVADINIPFFGYMGSEIDSLGFHLNSNRSDFSFSLGFNSIAAGPLSIEKTDLTGEVVDKILHLDFNSVSEGEKLYSIRSEITRKSDTVTLALNPSEVIINSLLWDVPASNLITVAPDFMAFEDFRLSREDQSIEITDEKPGVEKEHIALSFVNFNLQSFLGYFNPAEPLAEGYMEGSLTVENPFGRKGLVADVEINNFKVLEVPMGVLRLDARALSARDYNFDLAIKEGKADLDLTGGFTAAADGAEWFTELDLNKVEMEIIEAFSFGELKNTSGSFSGNVDLSGTFVDPEYSGQLHFQDAQFTVSKLDAPFMIRDETLALDTEGLYFDNFVIEDSDGNNFIVEGEMLTASPLNPEFGLAFSAEDFTLLNSSSEDNELFYGTAVIDLEAQLTGNLNVPNLQMDLNVDGATNLTYIIPESEVGIERREGIVRFVNRENPDAILTASQEESYAVSGIEIRSTVNINEDAVFNIIIDEQTGDNLQVVGEGRLLFNIFSNGRTTMSGRYEMSGGHYEMNLYGLVNRRFDIVEGSHITWAGDPFDAYLDLRASYTVETAASDLMAAQIEGADLSVRQRFRQELPFIVYLDVGGQLMRPVLNFGLDMPEEDQGAVGGQVYGRVQQINEQEQELNQQVFSLLVLNRFYPSTGNDGTGGGTMHIARDNLNDALSDQLNIISQNLIGEDSDLKLDFGLDTYTDYQGESPRERTKLDITAERTFMDDRLVARVGSEVDVMGSSPTGEEAPLIGNVSLEYLIEESGTWRIRGFRSNRFENIIEGQVIVSGIALIFQKEFNQFRELVQQLKKSIQKDGNKNN